MVIITAAAGLYLGDLRSGVNPLDMQSVYALLGIALVTYGSSALNQALERPLRRTHAAHPQSSDGDRPHRPGARVADGLRAGARRHAAAGERDQHPHHHADAAHRHSLRGDIHAAQAHLLTQHVHRSVSWRATSADRLDAARGLIEWPAVALFAILFVWQFPHFMAIGWLYRDDYRHGGIRLPATQQPLRGPPLDSLSSALLCRSHDPLCALAHLPRRVTGIPYATRGRQSSRSAISGTPSASPPSFAIRAHPETRKIARTLLRVSVIHLPLLMARHAAERPGPSTFVKQ